MRLQSVRAALCSMPQRRNESRTTRFAAWMKGPEFNGFGRKAVRSMSLATVVLGLPKSAWPQVQEKAAAPVSQIENQIKQHPNSSNLYVELGLAFWHENDYAHAFEAFQHAVKLGPSSAQAHNWLGAALMQQGDFPGAITEFKKAVALNAKYARAYTNLGSATAKNGDVSGAVVFFQKALSLEPSDLAAHLNLGIALREKGDSKTALAHLQSVTKREPNNVTALYLLGQTLQQSGNLAGAIETFEDLLRINPEFREGYYALGVALKQEAAALHKPRQPAASPADDLFRKGQQAAARGELKQAEQLLGGALDKDTNHAEAHNLLGFVLGQQGDLTSALTHLGRAVALRPDRELLGNDPGGTVELDQSFLGGRTSRKLSVYSDKVPITIAVERTPRGRLGRARLE